MLRKAQENLSTIRTSRALVVIVACLAIFTDTILDTVVAYIMLAETFTDNTERAKTIGLVQTGMTLGALVGPVIGGVMYQFLGYKSPFLLIAGMTVVDGVLRLLLPRKSELAAVEEEEDYSILNFLQDPYVMTTAGLALVPSAVGYVIGAFLSSKLVEMAGWHGSRYGSAFAISETAVCTATVVGLGIGGFLLNSVGFFWMMLGAGTFNILLSPLAILLRNPPSKEKKEKLEFLQGFLQEAFFLQEFLQENPFPAGMLQVFLQKFLQEKGPNILAACFFNLLAATK
uniref:Major facilitator superfamily (MFS) profile domain-containing protein n=1 Tax=Branchiostoma floridae TaxID=7739 RepID=C3Z0W2_BRAFL|eukprot:XP_002597854.1 hypothetical protein BRAFLDRAFT_105460 [Branchiostoma floridae]